MSKPMVLFSTCGDEPRANDIAQHLVELRLAACVNIIAGVKSTFWWEGEIRAETEYLIIIKSIDDNVQSIRQVIQDISGYHIPELIAMEIVDGSESYLDWLVSESRQPAQEISPD